jgi:hypothetical protein
MYITISKDNEIMPRNKTDFTNVYENLLVELPKIGLTSFVSLWMKDPKMRTYDKIDFLLMQQAPYNIYNTFKGYEADNKPLINNDIENSLIIKHIKNLCNNDDNAFQYVIKFLARKVQAPYNLTNTALIFKSKEGARKDLF